MKKLLITSFICILLAPGLVMASTQYTRNDIKECQLSPDTKNFNCVIKQDKKYFINWNGKEQDKYDSIQKFKEYNPYSGEYGSLMAFSPDGKRFAYIAKNGDKYYLVVNGKKSRAYSELRHPVFSPNSKSLAYSADINNTTYFIVNDKLVKQGDYIFGIVFSSDSKQYAYITGSNDGMVLNGKELKGYEKYYSPVFSPDSKQFSYKALKNDIVVTVLNGKELTYQNGGSYPGVFSQDSKKFAYAAYKDGFSTYVINEKKLSKWTYAQNVMVSNFIFSPDSKQYAYTAPAGYNKNLVVLNEKPQPIYHNVSKLAFSPDSKQFAYIAKTIEKVNENTMELNMVVLNGKEQNRFQYIDEIIFSPDSKSYAYGAGSSGVMLKGVALPESRSFISGTLAYSPDSKNFAFIIYKDTKHAIYLNGKVQKTVDYIPVMKFTPDSKSLVYVALIDGQLKREVIKLK